MTIDNYNTHNWPIGPSAFKWWLRILAQQSVFEGQVQRTFKELWTFTFTALLKNLEQIFFLLSMTQIRFNFLPHHKNCLITKTAIPTVRAMRTTDSMIAAGCRKSLIFTTFNFRNVVLRLRELIRIILDRFENKGDFKYQTNLLFSDTQLGNDAS